jgi:putative endopeptidase
MAQRVLLLFVLLCSFAAAQDRPLASLPYTPSLDVTAMDRGVDPCVDFFKYSCGNWIKNNPIPPDQARWNVYSKVADDNQRFLWGILDEASKPAAGRTPSQQKIGDFFSACMDESAVDRKGAAPIQEVLDEISSMRSIDALPSLLERLHSNFGARSLLFGFSSGQDFADSTRVIAFAAAGGLGLPDRDYYTKTDPKSVETRAKYAGHVQRTLELIGESPDTARTGAAQVMEIETALAKASLTRVEKRDPYKLFHRYTRTELLALTPSFNWGKYLNGSGVTVSEFNVTEPAFFKEMNSLLESIPLEGWKTYLRWHVTRSASPFLSSKFVDANFRFYGAYLRGVKEMQPRWKRCVQYVDRDLGEALGQVFVAKTFAPKTKADVLKMTRLIEDAMGNEIRELPWMSDATKQRALEKLGAIVNKVGYPDKWRDYSSLKIVRGDFMGNVERANAFERRRELAKIGKPVDRGEWQMTPPTVNAYYDPQMNDINFPAGVLQPPLYDPKMDDAPNYGNTGSTIGHELTHGFDDEGRQFDAKGNLKDWWTKQDAEQFATRTDCVANQYAQYTIIDDIKINSRLTLGEDVADLGGTLLAYIAWKKATEGQTLEPRDGLTPDQRFFVGFAQWDCGDERPESKRVTAVTDPHSPAEYRINGVVANLPEFGAAFSCKAGQPMVRAHACRVW